MRNAIRPPGDDLALRFAEIERRFRALETRAPGGLTGDGENSYLTGGRGLRVRDDGDITLEGGDFQIETAGGTFTLSPFEAITGADTNSGFSITTSLTTVNEVTLAIPDWVGLVTLMSTATLLAGGAGGSNRIVSNTIVNDAGGLDDIESVPYDLENNGLRYALTVGLNTIVANPGSTIVCRQRVVEDTAQGAQGDHASLQVLALLTA